MRTLAGLMLAAVVGCGGGQKTSHPPADQPITEAQCQQMADHMLDVQIASRPAAERPTGEQEAEIRQGIRADFVPACVKEVRQPTYECWMAATTVEAFESCAGREAGPPPEGAGPDPVPTDGDTEPGDPSP